MSGLTRERGCWYYVPWMAIFGLCFLGGAIGVWIHFSILAYEETKDGLDQLEVEAPDFDIPYPAVVATACVALAICVLVGLLSLCRSFIEAGHDATGRQGEGSTVWMWLTGIVSAVWWVVTIWMVLLIMGSSFYAGLLYVVESTIDRLQEKFGPESGVTSNPGEPCPAQCLNLMYFSFLWSNLQDSCRCDYTVLRQANDKFSEASRHTVPLLVGIWVAFAAVLVLLVDLACQFAHTKREKELIRRAHGKQFEIPDYFYKGANEGYR
mmetsp:Transcript_19603/g.54621  ORF Transcript_19603/g.54621 Transcript_19603/m.54621 type:complete len:266 (+) Transcript_19603:218-1015(+)